MPFPEIPEFTPDADPSRAFQSLDSYYRDLGHTVDAIRSRPVEEVYGAMFHYYCSGLVFLINSPQHPYLQNLARVTWNAIRQGQIVLSGTLDITDTLQGLGVAVQQLPISIATPFNYARYERQGIVCLEANQVILAPDYPALARTNPIEALGRLAAGTSLTYDIVNGRFREESDQRSSAIRSQAVLAEFLLRYPTRVVSRSPSSFQALRNYPRGLTSLPEHARPYRGIQHKMFGGPDS